jgi:hypothetical protein
METKLNETQFHLSTMTKQTESLDMAKTRQEMAKYAYFGHDLTVRISIMTIQKIPSIPASEGR